MNVHASDQVVSPDNGQPDMELEDMTQRLTDISSRERELLLVERQLMARERDLWNKEKELMERELSNVRSERQHIQNATCFRPKDVIDLIPEFIPGKKHSLTAIHWIQKVDKIAESYKWNGGTVLLQAVAKLKGAARTWYDGFGLNLDTWEKLREGMIEAFPNNQDESDIHQELMQRKKYKTESYEEYFYEMLMIGKRGSISDRAMVKYLITGLDDRELARTLSVCCDDDPQQLLQKVKAYEDTIVQNKYRQTTSWHGNFKNKFEKRESIQTDDKFQKTFQKPQTSLTTIRCYNCGAKGHSSNNCPDKERGPKCFNCRSYGHKALNCPDQNNTRAGINFVRDISDYHKNVTLNETEYIALLDTGSAKNLVDQQIVSTNDLKVEPAVHYLTGLGGSQLNCSTMTWLDLTIDDKKYTIEAVIVPKGVMTVDVLLGRPFLEKIDFKSIRGKLVIENEMNQENENLEERDDIFQISCDNQNKLELLHVKDHKIRNEIIELYQNYDPDRNKTKTTSMKARIILRDETPVYQNPRRLSYHEKKEVDRQMEDWLKEGIIKPSCSEYASPIVLVKKKDESIRICQDYRKLNEKIVKDHFPMPLIEDHLDRMCGAKIFSTIDLKNGFFHVPLEESSCRYTAFVTPTAQYEFLKTPFGMCNSPAVFQRFINDIFKEHIRNGIVLAYLDDVVILAKDEKEGLFRLKLILKTAEEYGLKINWKKCQFLMKNITYLGHHIEDGKIMPSSEKTRAVLKFPQPATVKQIQSFLGLTGYFRKFIRDYARIAKPLSDLIAKDVHFKFGAEEHNAFNTLKQLLCEKPILKIYSPDDETQLHTDASQEGYGAILLQKCADDNKFHPVYYMSRKTTPAERKYCSYELEVLAIVNALKKFRVYLLGIPFVIVTDCAAFTMTMKKKDLATRVARWVLLLEEYDYQIEHRPGKRVPHVDALSRNPVMIVTRNQFIESLRLAQLKDDHLKTIFSILEKQPFEDYIVENNLLYKEVKGYKLLVIPAKMQTEIIRRSHEDNGHFAIKKTQEIISREFWIPRLVEKIKNYIQNCIPCILTERKMGKQEGLLHPIDKGDLPFETYHIDHVGPLISTKKGYKHLFVVVDAFTKFVWIYPTKTLTSGEVIEKLKLQKTNFGNPRRIISDRGTAFSSEQFKSYCKEENIELFHITTGVPRGNGQVERINRIILPMLTKLSLEREELWYKHVDKVQLAINSTFQRSIGNTPFNLLFGVEMRKPENIGLKEIVEEEYKKQFLEERDEMRNEAKIQILRVQEENRSQYNKKRKVARKYEHGELVAIKRTQFLTQGKLRTKYLGPYRVTRAKLKDRYDVERIGPGEPPRLTSTSADFMKPWSHEEFDDEGESGDEEAEGSLESGKAEL